jgi:hypothetical protein
LKTQPDRTHTHGLGGNFCSKPNPTVTLRDRERFRKYSIQINVSNSNDHSNNRFRTFRQKKISKLMKKRVFRLVDFREISTNARFINSRFVDEIKNIETKKDFEKSCLVIQIYNDLNKDLILTQSSIIQRVSQRLIVCLTTTLREQDNDIELYLRDVTQTYVQLTFDLNRNFYIRSLLELIILLNISNDCILKMIKSLYDVLETSNHWFATYHRHHLVKLEMIESTYDSCLLYKFEFIESLKSLEHFESESLEIVDMQIDDILILVNSIFAAKKEKTIKKTKILTKTRDHLITKNSIKFNET